LSIADNLPDVEYIRRAQIQNFLIHTGHTIYTILLENWDSGVAACSGHGCIIMYFVVVSCAGRHPVMGRYPFQELS
jgi:hypothetical protein